MVPVAVIDADSPAASFTGVFIHIVLAGTDSFTVLGKLAPRAGSVVSSSPSMASNATAMK